MALYQAFLRTDEAAEPSFLQFASSNSETAKALISKELPQATLLCLEQHEIGRWQTLEGERPDYAIPLVLPIGHSFQVANAPVGDSLSTVMPNSADSSHSPGPVPEPPNDAKPPAIVMVLTVMGWLTISAGLFGALLLMETVDNGTMAIAWLFASAVAGTLILAMGVIIQNLWTLNRTLAVAAGLVAQRD